jgi:uncharacterized membrane protein YesL
VHGATVTEAPAFPDPGRFDDDLDVPPRPPLPRTTVIGALQPALVNLYFGSVRLLPANVLWAAVLLALFSMAVSGLLWLAVLLAPLMGVPLVGLFRLAAATTRGDEPRLRDGITAMRHRFVHGLVVAAALIWGMGLLGINVSLGLGSNALIGFAFATISGWGLVSMAAYATVIWPLLGDPGRQDVPLGTTLRLAGYILLAAPVRVITLALVVVLLLALSTVLLVLILTVAAAYVALLSCRVALPEADRLDERLAQRLGP